MWTSLPGPRGGPWRPLSSRPGHLFSRWVWGAAARSVEWEKMAGRVKSLACAWAARWGSPGFASNMATLTDNQAGKEDNRATMDDNEATMDDCIDDLRNHIAPSSSSHFLPYSSLEVCVFLWASWHVCAWMYYESACVCTCLFVREREKVKIERDRLRQTNASKIWNEMGVEESMHRRRCQRKIEGWNRKAEWGERSIVWHRTSQVKQFNFF